MLQVERPLEKWARAIEKEVRGSFEPDGCEEKIIFRSNERRLTHLSLHFPSAAHEKKQKI